MFEETIINCVLYQSGIIDCAPNISNKEYHWISSRAAFADLLVSCCSLQLTLQWYFWKLKYIQNDSVEFEVILLFYQ